MPLVNDILLRSHVWLLGILIVPMIKWLPLSYVLRLLTPPKWLKPYRRISRERILDLVDRRLAQPKVMVHRPCLRRGLVLFHVLQLSGLPAKLNFAIYSPLCPKTMLRGHCWVMVDDWCAGDPPASSLTIIWTHPKAKMYRDS